MKLRFNLLIAIIFACIAFSNAYALESKKLDMFDESRGRNIPVVVYQGEAINKQVVIISHGYGVKNSQYCFIANDVFHRHPISQMLTCIVLKPTRSLARSLFYSQKNIQCKAALIIN